jgi:hypothetical protein
VKAPSKKQLLAELSQIDSMEKGKLCACAHRPSSEQAGYSRLQYWENGRNVSRHVPADELPALQEAIAGYQQARALTEQYLEMVVTETRERMAGSKKNGRSRPGPRARS